MNQADKKLLDEMLDGVFDSMDDKKTYIAAAILEAWEQGYTRALGDQIEARAKPAPVEWPKGVTK
tara:strand:- start:329 stop:523 length:195 start_codon:yes stop_codon:yes gene_type:complete